MIVDLKEWTNKISVVSTGVGVAIWLALMLPQTFVPQSMAPVLGGLWHASLPIAAAVLGWLYGTKAWHCGFRMLGVQLLIMVVLSGPGNMFPVIVGYYLLLVGICALAAVVAAYVRRAVQTRSKTGKRNSNALPQNRLHTLRQRLPVPLCRMTRPFSIVAITGLTTDKRRIPSLGDIVELAVLV